MKAVKLEDAAVISDNKVKGKSVSNIATKVTKYERRRKKRPRQKTK
jgi:hypothetical protein